MRHGEISRLVGTSSIPKQIALSMAAAGRHSAQPCDARPCQQQACAGPAGGFHPSAFFQVAMASALDIQLLAPFTVVPLNYPIANRGGGRLDAVSNCYVTPKTGPYHFDFSVLLVDTGVGPALNAAVTLALEVDSVALVVPTVQVVACQTSFSGTVEEVKSLKGSATLELLEGQTVRLTLKNETGNTSTFLVNSENFPLSTFLSGFSLF